MTHRRFSKRGRTAFKLWDHQRKAIRECIKLIEGGEDRVCVVAPTGAGKTAIAAELAMRFVANGGQVVFLAPKIVLVEQTVKAWAKRTGLPVAQFGVLQADNTRNLDAKYIVATPQTARTRGLPEGVGMVVIDECHNRHKTIFAQVSVMEPKPIVVGLTATPYTPCMGEDYDDNLVLSATTDELTETDVLVNFKPYAAKPIDTAGLRAEGTNGDYGSAKEIERRTKQVLIRDGIARWKEKCIEHFGELVPTLVFTRSIGQGEKMAKEFRRQGLDFRQVASGDDHVYRERCLADFRAGRCLGLISCDVLAEGFDVPDVRCVMLARPQRSLKRMVQTIGRGLRSCDGKDFAIVVDMTNALMDSWGELQDHLSIGPQGFESPKGSGECPMKECPACHAIVPIGTLTCPHCGYQWPEGTRERDDGILHKLERRNEQVRRDYERGMSAKKIGDKFGVSSGAVFKWLKVAGVETRSNRKSTDDDAIVRDYEAGMSAKQVAIKHGISSSTVKDRLNEAGVRIRSSAEANWKATDDAAVVRDYGNGMSLKEVAAKHGVGPVVIRRRLKVAGVRIRSLSEAMRNATDDDAIVRDYESGMSMTDVAAKHGIGRSTVRGRLMTAGVRIRSRSEVAKLRGTDERFKRGSSYHLRSATRI